MDLIVRRPDDLRRRLEEGDWFLREIMATGKVLYEKTDGAVGAERGRRLDRRPRRRPKPPTR